MATALVSAIRGSGKSAPSGPSFIVTIYFSGDDVSSDVEGQPVEAPVTLPTGYTLGDLKAGIASAVTDAATTLGLAVATSDVDLLSFDHGGGPP